MCCVVGSVPFGGWSELGQDEQSFVLGGGQPSVRKRVQTKNGDRERDDGLVMVVCSEVCLEVCSVVCGFSQLLSSRKAQKSSSALLSSFHSSPRTRS